MSNLTYDQAKDDILTLLKTAWDTTTYQMFYDTVRDQRDDTQVPWASAHLRHVEGRQSTIGGVNYKIFERSGVLMVDIRTPSGTGLSEGYSLAKVVSDAFEGISSPGGVWFRNVRINELGRDGSFFITKVLIDFTYCERK